MFVVEPVSNIDIDNKDEFLEFCKKAYESNHSPACVNMWHPDWENRPETLPFLIYKSNRFSDNGIFFTLRINGKIEAVSGIYISEFDNTVAIGGVRSWTNPGHQADLVIGRHIFPIQLKWAKCRDIKTIVLTFNEYNKRLINYFKRTGVGVVKNRTPDMLFYNGVHEVPFPIKIQNTKQWAIYHKIDETYEPKWETIRYEEPT